MRLAFLTVLLALFLPVVTLADESPLRRLQTGDDSRGWNAVGRLNLGDRGFCTGTLIAPQLVLTAAHCMFDKESGRAFTADEIQFLAGWRNGRAEAYRGVRRMVVHPEYTFDSVNRLDRVGTDLALLELDQPIRLPSITPFATGPQPLDGDAVGVVSYAQDRSEAPSLQQLCHVLGEQPGVLVLTCDVDFGSSGAPVFAMKDGVEQIVSVISAKAELDGRKVALGVSLEQPLGVVMAALEGTAPALPRSGAKVISLSGGTAGGAKFISASP